jgi:hypothetical protein
MDPGGVQVDTNPRTPRWAGSRAPRVGVRKPPVRGAGDHAPEGTAGPSGEHPRRPRVRPHAAPRSEGPCQRERQQPHYAARRSSPARAGRPQPPRALSNQTAMYFCGPDHRALLRTGPDHHALLWTRPPCTSADQTAMYFCGPDHRVLLRTGPDRHVLLRTGQERHAPLRTVHRRRALLRMGPDHQRPQQPPPSQ